MSTENYHSNNEDDFIDRQSSVLSDVTHENGSDSSASPSQPQKVRARCFELTNELLIIAHSFSLCFTLVLFGMCTKSQKKVKVEESSPPVPSYGAFTGIAGDPNMLALGSMGMRHPAPAFNPNFSLAFGNGLPMASSFNGPQPTLQTSFPGTSPGFHSMAMPSGHPFFGFGPGYAAMANQHWSVTASTTARGNDSETPDAHSNDNDDDEQGNEGRDDAESGEGNGKPKRLSGMTPLAFAPLASNHPMMARAAVNGSFHPGLMQVVSTDSQTDSNRGGVPAMMVAPAPQLAMMHPFGNHAIPLQKPKKWVRWSDQEDLTLRRAVEQLGDNSFLHISEQIFRGTRTEAQCKSRWKKVRVYALVCGAHYFCILHSMNVLPIARIHRHCSQDLSGVDGRKRRITLLSNLLLLATLNGRILPNSCLAV